MARDQQKKIVGTVSEETMDGDTPLEKRLNAYLTRQFILDRGVPSDECLKEARRIIAMVQEQ